jgi:hypothetical protein
MSPEAMIQVDDDAVSSASAESRPKLSPDEVHDPFFSNLFDILRDEPE